MAQRPERIAARNPRRPQPVPREERDELVARSRARTRAVGEICKLRCRPAEPLASLNCLMVRPVRIGLLQLKLRNRQWH